MNNKPIRILHIVGSTNRGGIENFLINTYRMIDRNKVQFDFLVTREEKGAFDDEIKLLGGKVFHIPHITKVILPKYMKNINDFFEIHNEYKIVHSHIITTSGFFLPVAKKKGINIRISHGHSAPPKQESRSVLKFIEAKLKIVLKHVTVKYSTHYFSCGYEAGVWLFGKEIADNKMVVVKNAIDTEKFNYNIEVDRKVRKELLIPEDALVVGHVGNFSEVKNHMFLIDIFYFINKIIPNSILCLVGDGKLRPNIEDEVRCKKLENNVKILGTRGDVNDLLKAFDIFLMPSLFEGLPVALIEAQASGLQCVVSDTITDEVKITDLVDFISLDKSPEYWAEQVLKYADGYERKNTYIEICNAGYEVKENAKLLENFYLEEHSKICSKHCV